MLDYKINLGKIFIKLIIIALMHHTVCQQFITQNEVIDTHYPINYFFFLKQNFGIHT